jgi:hypothetical protein
MLCQLVDPRIEAVGPIALFDKSFLQSLSVDESVWFDHYFYPNICPLFYVETLADLSLGNGALPEGRSPEREVAIIADKVPEASGVPCVHHRDLCINDLMGDRIPMNGQIPVAGGRPVRAGSETGVVFETSPEAQAFSRWQRHEFQDVERLFARGWRDMLTNLDLKETAKRMRALGISPQNCKSLAQAHALATDLVRSRKQPHDQMALLFSFVHIPPRYMQDILRRWSIDSYRPLAEYAPYAAHVLAVELFFQIALAAGLISAERASNRIDIGYLFYLPFCIIFVSWDKLHRSCAPLFLRDDQDFVWGQDLKAELSRVNKYFLGLPLAEREKSVQVLAPHPVGDDNSLLVKLWDRHVPRWRKSFDITEQMDSEAGKELAARLQRIHQGAPIPPSELDTDQGNIDQIAIHRSVRQRKGSWWQLPKDLGNGEQC